MGERLSRRETQRLYDLTKWKTKEHQGTPYPCAQSILDGYVELAQPNRHQKVDPMMSTYQLVRHNRPYKDLPQEEADAIERLRDCLKIKNWGPDLIIKAFRDLDTVFFRERVIGNCLVRWRDREGCIREHRNCHYYGATSPLGPLENRQVQITLNANIMFFECEDPYTEMWRTILHEMIHAYAMITSGWVEPHTAYDQMAGNEPGHGIHFGTSIMAVHKRAKKLFGLVVMDDPDCTPFRFDYIPKKELKRFEEFIIQQKREQERQKGWDMYYEDMSHRGNRRRR